MSLYDGLAVCEGVLLIILESWTTFTGLSSSQIVIPTDTAEPFNSKDARIILIAVQELRWICYCRPIPLEQRPKLSILTSLIFLSCFQYFSLIFYLHSHKRTRQPKIIDVGKWLDLRVLFALAAILNHGPFIFCDDHYLLTLILPGIMRLISIAEIESSIDD